MKKGLNRGLGTIFESENSTLTPESFLAEYWQRKPCLLRQAFPGFEPPIDGDDLAGLATDPLAESRLVTGSEARGGWTLRHGPFEDGDFAGLGERDWTLLVQDVEKHFPPLAGLLAHFDFLPAWRLDDIMVSFAAPGGGVGPHVDQYDVFLLQAQGRRRWDIAKRFDPTPVPDVPLKLLAQFEPEQTWVLEPGDLLYLPPGVAHHGVALDPGLTYSIGLRAPSAADLMLGFGEWLSDQADEGGRYSDAGLSPPARTGEVDAAAMERAHELLRVTLGREEVWREFLVAWLSRYRLAHEPAPPPEPIGVTGLEHALARGATLHRHPWTRLCWHAAPQGALLYAAGEAFPCRAALAEALCGAVPLNAASLASDADDLTVVAALLDAGHLLLETPAGAA